MRITKRPRNRAIPRPPDWASHADAFKDNKQWVSMGLVVDDPEVPPVEFNREDGQVYVNVSLEPSKVPVRARVAGQVAGAGEAEYFPFMPNDEVVVLIPQGDEGAGCVIIGRLNQALDPFPMDSVAGQDPTTNTFAFRRRRTPVVEEFAGPVLFRNALSGALFSLDDKGGVTLKDGENSALQISADAMSLVGPSDPQHPPTMLLQMNFTEERGMFQVGDAQLLLNSSKSGDPSFLTLPDALFVSFGNNQPAEHVATVEMVLAMLYAFGNALLPIAGGPAALIVLAAAISSGAGAPLHPLAAAALASGFPLAAQTPKPPANPLTGLQMAPGLGAVNFHTG